MKFPNGYGSCYRLPGNRRKPWAVRISIGKDGGRMKYKYLGFFASQEEGLQCLAEYNKDPYDPDARRVTFSQLYEILCKDKGSKVYNTAYNHLAALHDVPFSALRPLHLNRAVSDTSVSTSSIRHIRSLLTVMYKFAVENDYAARDFSGAIDLSRYADRAPDPHPHTVFTEAEIRQLWDKYRDILDKTPNIWSKYANFETKAEDSGTESADNQYLIFLTAVYCLILIYTGLRINELLGLKKDDIDLEQRVLYVRASKTAAGVRSVPICSRILPLLQDLYNISSGSYLCINVSGGHIAYSYFHTYYWMQFMTCMKLSHRIHDCRHTMVSRLTAAGVDTRLIGRIVGHASGSVTVDVYTHFDLDTMLSAVELLV